MKGNHHANARWTRRGRGILLRGAWALALAVVASSGFSGAPASLNNDDDADLIIGIPYEEISGFANAGAITIFHANASGIPFSDVSMWHQDSTGVEDACETSDWFGYSLATGDFDGDGYVDLSVGVAIENVGTAASAGIVQIFYGSPSGINGDRDAIWHQGSPGVDGAVEEGDRFGSSQAVGDFDGDGFADLAIGVPEEDIEPVGSAGAVNVLYGSDAGITATGNQLFYQGHDGLWGEPDAGDRFGSALAAGDFDGDGFDDLVIGVPEEDLLANAVVDAGQIYVFYGSAQGLSTGNVDQWFPYDFGSGISEAEDNDRFGSALAVGDFDGNGYDDLAIGIPYEGVGSVSEAGAVQVMYGSAAGLTTAGADFWHQDVPDILEWADVGDRFGTALAAGDFDGNGADDLAIGVPYEGVGSTVVVSWAGCVNVLYGSNPGGLSAAGNQLWHQDVAEIVDTAETGDRFGSALATGRTSGRSYDYLAIGVPFEEVNGVADAGAVQVLYGWSSGLIAGGNQLWHQDSTLVPGGPEPGDRFGSALATAGWSHALIFRDTFESGDTDRWSAVAP